VTAAALVRTDELLAALGVRGREHRVTVTDMASIWS